MHSSIKWCISLLLLANKQLFLRMCLPELSEDDSGNYDVCCGGMHSYMGSVFFCIVDLWSTLSMFFITTWFHYYDDPISWSVLVPIIVLYFSFMIYLSGPIGLYVGVSALINNYHHGFGHRDVELVTDKLHTNAFYWVIHQSPGDLGYSDTVLSVLWFFTAVTYYIGLSIHGTTVRFFKNRWFGYDDGDLKLAAKLRAQGDPVAALNLWEYFRSTDMERASSRRQITHELGQDTGFAEQTNFQTQADQTHFRTELVTETVLKGK